MRILLLGSGGREHALAWKMIQSPKCEKLFVAPGNGGTHTIAENVNIPIADFEKIKLFIAENKIDTLVVGPELPAVLGLYDFCKNQNELQDLKIICPSAEGAKLEGSKAYAKKFMIENQIPTAQYLEVNQTNLQKGMEFLEQLNPPFVLKADGLAEGKGVLIIESRNEAVEQLQSMILEKRFGTSSETVVIEEFLKGIEFSVFVITDGKNYKILPNAKDYKRIGEGDTGLNTGGMGCISPVPFVDEILMQKVEQEVIIPTIEGLKNRKIAYQGFIYIGLINVDGNPKVIEYNCRMGDPETEVVMPRLENDLLGIFEKMCNGEMEKINIKISTQHCATVMMVSGGYPQAYEKGKIITGLENVTSSIAFHAGTKIENNQILTNGGRVLAISSLADDLSTALQTSYQNIEKIKFDQSNYRRDIGWEFI